ncbi:MAG: hypothetical protein WBK47_01140 [Acetomicrobium sp.]
MEDVEKRAFLLDFLNEIYSTCDLLDIPVPDDIDDARELDCLLKIARKIGCRLMPFLTVTEIREFVLEYSEEKAAELDEVYDKLPLFKLRIVPWSGLPVFYYRMNGEKIFYEVMYFPDTNVCIIAKFSYRDLQSFKRLGDFDTDTRIATGDDAQKCIGILK